MSKFGPKCQYFLPPLFSRATLTLLGMEFTRASQVATRVLFHSSMTTSQSWWMLETLHSSTFHYTSCTLTTLHCSKVSFLQCCHMKIYIKICTNIMRGVLTSVRYCTFSFTFIVISSSSSIRTVNWYLNIGVY